MNRVLELAAWIELTLGLHQVKEILAGTWEPPPSVRILARRPSGYARTDPHLSVTVDWHRLNPEDFVEPA